MFRSIWSKTLRDYRVPVLCWGIGIGLVMLALFVSTTPEIRAEYAKGVASLTFFGDMIAVETPGGYATFRMLGFFGPLVLSIWPILAGARLLRGEEERGSLDLLLATPQSRTRVLIEKVLAYTLALLIMGVLVGLGNIAGEAGAKLTVDAGAALLAGLQMSLIAFFFGTLAVVLSQFTSNRGAAAGWAGVLLVLAFVIDGTGRTLNNGVWLRRFSPAYYYNLSKPLIPTYHSNYWGLVLLLGLSTVFIAVSVPLFARRDIGGTVLVLQSRSRLARMSIAQVLQRAWHDVFVSSVGLRALRAQAVSTFWWLLGLIAFGAFVTLLIPNMEEPMRHIAASNPALAKLFNGQNAGTNSSFLELVAFIFLPVLSVMFTMMLALRWASDLDNGRLELILSTPKSRARVLLERFGSILVAALLAPLFIWAAIVICASAINIAVDSGKVLAASLSILPLELIVVTLIYALAGRLRYSLVLGLTTLYLALAFFVELLQAFLHLPDGVMALSIFHEYGSPITDGWQWESFSAMLGVALVLLIIAVLQFRFSDLERG